MEEQGLALVLVLVLVQALELELHHLGVPHLLGLLPLLGQGLGQGLAQVLGQVQVAPQPLQLPHLGPVQPHRAAQEQAQELERVQEQARVHHRPGRLCRDHCPSGLVWRRQCR